jgi:SAM-dependent methyltransferase
MLRRYQGTNLHQKAIASKEDPVTQLKEATVTTRRVLNVGCGSDLYGTHRLDIDPASRATERGSAMAMPYRDALFDEVYAANVLEHMPNPLLFLTECRRVMRPGAKLILITDHAGRLGYHVRGFRAVDNHGWHGVGGDRHFMLFNTGHIRNLLDAAGLRVERLELFNKHKLSLRGLLLARLLRPLAMANIRVHAFKP